MDKPTIKSFIAWLETASDKQLAERQEQALKTLDLVKSQEVRADVRLAIRLIDEELMARLQLAQQA